MTDWTIFARADLSEDARDFDVLWDGASLLLEGAAPDWSDLESLDAVFDGRFAALDAEASQLAENAGRACAALDRDALALRYECVRLLRLATFFTVVRPLAAGAVLTFYHDPERDADYAALLESLTKSIGAELRLAAVRPEPNAPRWRVDQADPRVPAPKSPNVRSARSEPLAWRAWAAQANAAFDVLVNAIRRDSRRPVVLLGRPEILDGVCSELVARGERVVWVWEHFHARVFARWRAAGVQLVTLDHPGVKASRTTASGTSRLTISDDPESIHSAPDDAPPSDLDSLSLQYKTVDHGRIDFAPAIRAWATTREADFARHKRLAARFQQVFAGRSPKALVVDEDATPLKRVAIATARRSSAASFVVQHGAPGVRFGFAPCAADVHLAWGEASRRRLLEWGVPEQAIDVVGCPRRDGWKDIARRDRASGRARTSHAPCPTVLVLASPAPRDDRPDSLAFPLTTAAHREIWSNVFRTLAGRPDVRALVKLHPRDASHATLARLAHEIGARVEWRSQGDASDYFAECDAVISLASSAGLEAAAWGLPVVSVVPARSADLYTASEWGLIAEVRSLPGLEAALECALARPALSRDVHEAQLQHTFCGLDGRAATRVVEAIVARVGGARKSRAA